MTFLKIHIKRFFYPFLSITGFAGCIHPEEQSKAPVNVLLIVVDDMNYNSTGVFGCKTPHTTPNIDKFAEEGIRFTNAHVQVAVSQPCRNSIATGMYPHKSRLEGFYGLPDTSNIPLVYEILQNHGFLTCILGKVEHSTPKANFKWDMNKDRPELGQGRNPELYYNYAKEFFAKVKKQKKPFYFMANSHDPHRPFNGSEQESRYWPHESITKPSKVYSPSEVIVPGFLPDIADVRLEISEYFSSVRRADDCVGKILQALKESGLEENTIIIFLSDNGMSLPYSKTNCYLNSTKTPLIVKWPGKIKPNTVDSSHFISTIDLMPTILEINGIAIPQAVDGISMLPVLRGNTIENKDMVFTQFFETSNKNRYPMRCVQNKRYGYIFNAWANDKREFKNESQAGRTFKAMRQASKTDSSIARRVDFFLHRMVEEFYDFQKDPDALHNLINDPDYKNEIKKFQTALEKWMRENGDGALEAFINRSNPQILNAFMEQQQKEASNRNINAAQNE